MIDPDADELRKVAADLHADATRCVDRCFGWIDAQLATGGSRGGLALLFAEMDLDHGRPMADVLAGLLIMAPLFDGEPQ
jgi:hypothetical protein